MSAEPQFPESERGLQSRHLRAVPSSTKAEQEGASRPARALVPEAAPRTQRTLMILLFASIPLILLLVLLINILTAQRQYDLVDLRAQELSLTQQNEALSQEIAFHQAPQDLAIRASQLGLVSTQAQATINLQTGEISGVPMSAVAPQDADAQKNLVAPPALYDTKAYATASQRAEEQRKQEEEKRKAEEAKKKAKEDAEKKASASPSAATPSASAMTSAPASSPSAEPTPNVSSSNVSGQ